ncbi:MAG TPA: hypothetical protein DCG49_03420 [Ruminococcus sp.]|nr:hypothetical protein [Ruminococcus sp.]
MTLLIACAAASISTVVWYLSEKARKMQIGTLCLMYWGASLMWFVDAVVEYFELRDAFFTPSPDDMLNDAFLGLSVAVVGLIIWLAIVIVKDPLGTVRASISKKA